MRQRTFALAVVSFLLLICLFTGCSKSGVQNGGSESQAKKWDLKTNNEWEYKVYDNYIEIVKGRINAEEISIPAEIDGKPVKVLGNTSIAPNNNNKVIKKVIISESVEEIDSKAFKSLTVLEDVVVNSNNKNFIAEDGVVYDSEKNRIICYPSKNSTEEYTVPSTVKHISGSQFSNCESLKTVILPEGLETIGNYAFKSCKNLEEVVIPKDTTVDPVVFFGCPSLKRVTLPQNITEDHLWILASCEVLEEITGFENTYAPEIAKELNVEFVSLGEAITQPTVYTTEEYFSEE